MTAESSIRLLVASGSPPVTVSRSPFRSMVAANPPGPGLPRQAPSVWMTMLGVTGCLSFVGVL